MWKGRSHERTGGDAEGGVRDPGRRRASVRRVCRPQAPSTTIRGWQPPSPPRYAGVSLGHRQFTPTGSGTIDYGTLVAGLVFHQEPLDLLFGYAAVRLSDTATCSRSSVATTVGFDIPLQRSPGGGLFIPVVITGDYMKAEASDVQRDDFNVGSIGLGTGLKARSRVTGGSSRRVGRPPRSTASRDSAWGPGSRGSCSPTQRPSSDPFRCLDGLAVGYRFRMQTVGHARHAVRLPLRGPRPLSRGPLLMISTLRAKIGWTFTALVVLNLASGFWSIYNFYTHGDDRHHDAGRELQQRPGGREPDEVSRAPEQRPADGVRGGGYDALRDSSTRTASSSSSGTTRRCGHSPCRRRNRCATRCTRCIAATMRVRRR